MTPVTRLEKWIAPRAIPLLVVISALVIAGGTAAYFIRQSDINRVERLERVILCQHNQECREFVERAIREILREQEQKAPKDGQASERHQGVTFKIGPMTEDSAPPLVVEVDSGEGPPTPSDDQPSAPQKPKPKNPKESSPRNSPAPSGPAQPDSEASQREPRSAEASPITGEATKGPVTAVAEAAEEVLEEAKEIPCSALREVHGLC